MMVISSLIFKVIYSKATPSGRSESIKVYKLLKVTEVHRSEQKWPLNDIKS